MVKKLVLTLPPFGHLACVHFTLGKCNLGKAITLRQLVPHVLPEWVLKKEKLGLGKEVVCSRDGEMANV